MTSEQEGNNISPGHVLFIRTPFVYPINKVTEMKQKVTSSLLFHFGILTVPIAVLTAVLIAAIGAAIACGGEPETREPVTSGARPRSSIEIPSNKKPDASISGTVNYRERLALSPGAKLIFELRDVSYADAAAPLISRQTIIDPGQVPIKFKVDYNRQDIDARNTYAISATIFEADGRMAFTNDTAYDVITRGNPKNVEMLLVLVQPPPGSVDENAPDWRSWIEVPAQITGAHLMENEREPTLRVTYLQSTVENCARRGNERFKVDGNDVIVTVTLMQHPETPWSGHCDDELVELDTIKQIGDQLMPGQTYQVIVNERHIATITAPESRIHDATIVDAAARG